jgi:APA family basic amino acid/polyamine antiporter
LFTTRATKVNEGGTPVFALAVTATAAIIFSSIGSFEILLAVSQFFAVVITILLIVALFILRRREPDLHRPYRAKGHPIAPAIMLVGAVLLFFGYIYSNLYPSLYALAVLAVSYPVFTLVRKRSTDSV